MREIVLICAAALIVGCGTHNVTPSSAGGIPYMISHLTVAEANKVLHKGMSMAEVGDAIASVPWGGVFRTYFGLADGSLVCWFDQNDKLEDWLAVPSGSNIPPRSEGRVPDQ